MAVITDDRAFYPIDGNGKVTVADLKQTINAGAAVPVIDNVTSTSPTSALSANQGKVLSDAIAALTVRVTALETP